MHSAASTGSLDGEAHDDVASHCYVRGWMGLNWREERGAGCNRGGLQGEVRDLGELVPSEMLPITERRQGKQRDEMGQTR